MKFSRYLFAPFLALLFAITAIGCSTLGAPAPKTFLERAAAAQTAVTALRTSAASLLTAGSISVADAKNVRSSADNVNEAIDVALTAYKLACPAPAPAASGVAAAPCASPAADAKLASALSILTAAQTYLRSKGTP